MAIIKGGTSGASADVDTTPKAQRVIQYDPHGNPTVGMPALGSFMARINVRQTAASVADSVVYALWNPTGATRTILVRSIRLQLFFDGTAAATLMKYKLFKATGMTAYGTGTAVTAMAKRTSLTATGQPRVLDTGMTLTGATGHVDFDEVTQGRVTQTTTVFSSTLREAGLNDFGEAPLELAAGEVLGIRLGAAAVIGDNCIGTIMWDER